MAVPTDLSLLPVGQPPDLTQGGCPWPNSHRPVDHTWWLYEWVPCRGHHVRKASGTGAKSISDICAQRRWRRDPCPARCLKRHLMSQENPSTQLICPALNQTQMFLTGVSRSFHLSAVESADQQLAPKFLWAHLPARGGLLQGGQGVSHSWCPGSWPHTEPPGGPTLLSFLCLLAALLWSQ